MSVGIATSTTKHFRKEGIPLIRNQNVKEDGLSVDDLLFISESFDRANKNKRLKYLDIVTVRTGYPGLSCVVSEEMEGWQTFTTLISRPKQEKFNSHFITLLINSHVGMKQIANLQGGGAQQNLNVGWLVNMELFRPSRDEQTEIVHMLNSIAKSIKNDQIKLSKLCQLKAGLMQDLFTGKVSVRGLLAESTGISAAS